MELKQYANIGLVHAMAYPEANSSEYEYLSTLEKRSKTNILISWKLYRR